MGVTFLITTVWSSILSNPCPPHLSPWPEISYLLPPSSGAHSPPSHSCPCPCFSLLSTKRISQSLSVYRSPPFVWSSWSCPYKRGFDTLSSLGFPLSFLLPYTLPLVAGLVLVFYLILNRGVSAHLHYVDYFTKCFSFPFLFALSIDVSDLSVVCADPLYLNGGQVSMRMESL